MGPDTNINAIQDLQTILADYQQISNSKNEEGGYAGLETTSSNGALKLFQNGTASPQATYQTDRIHRRDTDPTIDDDDFNGYLVEDIWLNQVTMEMFICKDTTDGAAIWEKFYGKEIRLSDVEPAAAPTDGIITYSKARAGRSYLEILRPSGRDIPLGFHIGWNNESKWYPSVTTTVSVVGMPRTAVGTVSTPALAATSFLNSIRRWRVTSATTANSASDERSALTLAVRGHASVAINGGFNYVSRFAVTTLPALARGFWGLSSSVAAISTSQSVYALTNIVGVGFETGTDTTWQVLYNDGTGAATKIDTGITIDTTSFFTLVIACSNNQDSINLRFVKENPDDFQVFEYLLDTDIPAINTLLSVRNYMNNGGTAAACAYECAGVYLGTDY